MAGPSHAPVGGKPTYAMILRGHVAASGPVDETVSGSSPSIQKSTTVSPKATPVLSLRPLIRDSLDQVEGTDQEAGSKTNEAGIQGHHHTDVGSSSVAEIRATPPKEHPHLPPGLEAHIPGPRSERSPATLPSNSTSKVMSLPRSEQSEPKTTSLLPLEYDSAFLEKAYVKVGAKTLEQKLFVDYLYSYACGLPVPWPGSPKKTRVKSYLPSLNTPSPPYPGYQQSSQTAASVQGGQSGVVTNPSVTAGAWKVYNNPLGGSNGMYQPYQGALPHSGIPQPDVVHKTNQLQQNAYGNSHPMPEPFRPPPYSSLPQLPEAPRYTPRPQGGSSMYQQQGVHSQPFTYVGPQQQAQPPHPQIHPQSTRTSPMHHNSTHQVTPGVGTNP